MPLSDTFTRNTKHSGTSAGDKYSDGGGMYLHITKAGKYWRMNYRFAGKQKTLALGVYPVVSLAKARQGRDKAREMLAQGVDPSTAKKDDKMAIVAAAANTFEAVARKFHALKSGGWSEGHATKWLRMNELYLFPHIGTLPLSMIKAPSLLATLRKVEKKGISAPHRIYRPWPGKCSATGYRLNVVSATPG